MITHTSPTTTPVSRSRRPSRASRFRVKIAAWLLAAYSFLVALVVFTPSPVDKPLRSDLDRILQELHERGLPSFIGYGDVEFLANVAMFVPIGFLAAIALPQKAWPLLLVIGPALSAAIETIQRVVLPERYATLQDIVANGSGAVAGAIIAVVLRLLISHRDRLVVEDDAEGRRSL